MFSSQLPERAKGDSKPVDKWVLGSHMLVCAESHDASCVISVFSFISVFAVLYFILSDPSSFQNTSWKVIKVQIY